MTTNQQSQSYTVYIGTYANRADNGIYVYNFDTTTGQFVPVENISGIDNPSFLTIDTQKLRLYATSETSIYQEHDGGSVASYAIDEETGKLRFLNQEATYGRDSCHLSIDPTSSLLITANYSGGNVATFPVLQDGQIEKASQVIKHEGKGVREDRQEGPHPHSATITPDGQYVLICDLGIDKIITYRLDLEGHQLIFHNETKVAAGAGPRHLAFHPSNRYVYVINELDSTITAFIFDAEEVTLQAIQTISTLPGDFQGENTTADIHVSADGKFLYGSNRGHDSIAVFRLEPETGLLTAIQYISTNGKTPRNFALSPDGGYLLAANQDTDTLVTYTIDPITGQLTPHGEALQISRPVCIKFLH